jgi:hypothetical protein
MDHYTRKIGRTGQPKSPSYYVTIPRELIKQLGWYDGKRLKVYKVKGRQRIVFEGMPPLKEYKLIKEEKARKKRS